MSTGLENEINTNKITDVIIENDMILFLTGDKKDLTCPVLIDKKQLTPEELEASWLLSWLIFIWLNTSWDMA